MFTGRDRFQVKTPEQVELMRAAGLVVGGTLALLTEALTPGMTTRDLDVLAEDYIRSHNGVPSFLGYNGFPATICVSVNEQIVHGIPGDLVIEDGDLVSIDAGAIVDGWHGDAAVTVALGEVTAAEAELVKVCEDALWRGLAAAQVHGRLSDISHAVEASIRSAGRYGIVEEYVGHGIGTEMHMDPQVPNYGAPGKGPKLVAGMALAIEPMVNLGDRHTRVLADEWTVVTADGQRSAHFEHTVALTDRGPWVLTALDGGAARFAALGVATPASFPSPPVVP
jgi:methionyl aminopeptidase